LHAVNPATLCKPKYMGQSFLLTLQRARYFRLGEKVALQYLYCCF